jgi:hypothetical protein
MGPALAGGLQVPFPASDLSTSRASPARLREPFAGWQVEGHEWVAGRDRLA